MGSSYMEPRKLIYQGYLHKSPPEKKMDKDKWQKRLFKLWDNSQMEYYRNEKELRPIKPPLDLTECLEVSVPKIDLSKYYKKEFRYPFGLRMPGRLYYLIAGSEDERKCWKEKICEYCSFGTTELRHPEEVIGMLVSNSKYSPYSSSNSSHNEERRSGSDSSGSRVTRPIAIDRGNISNRSSVVSDDYENAYNELPPPRLANISSSFDNSYINSTVHALSTSFNDTYKTSSDSISTNKSFNSDSRSFTSDNRIPSADLDVFSGYVYDIPPPSRNSRLKQLSTKSSPKSDIGYVKMDPCALGSDGREDYIEMQGEPQTPSTPSEEYIQINGEEYIKMFGTSPPNELTSRGSVKEFKPVGSTLNRMGSMPSRFNTSHTLSPKHNINDRLGTSFEEEERDFDEIPVIAGNKSSMEGLSLGPPAVDRAAKPCPAIDRSTKPKFTLQNTDVESPKSPTDASGYFYFSRHDSDDYQNSSTNVLTSNDYVNNNVIGDINNYDNNSFDEIRTLTESLSTPVPYSSHKSYDETSFDRTDYYRDTNNNDPAIQTLINNDEYARKELHSIPPKFRGKDLPPLPPHSSHGEPDAYYENLDAPFTNFEKPQRNSTIDNEHMEGMFEEEEPYENVDNVNQGYRQPDEDLMYIHCSPKSTKTKASSSDGQMLAIEPGYVRIDPFKSAAAQNLR